MRVWRRKSWRKRKRRWISTRFNGTYSEDNNCCDFACANGSLTLPQSKIGSPTNATNPFLASPPASSGNIVDFFGAADPAAAPQQQTNALDDLLQLGNPFADMFGGAPAQQPAQQAPTNQWMSNGRLTRFLLFPIWCFLGSFPYLLQANLWKLLVGKDVVRAFEHTSCPCSVWVKVKKSSEPSLPFFESYFPFLSFWVLITHHTSISFSLWFACETKEETLEWLIRSIAITINFPFSRFTEIDF